MKFFVAILFFLSIFLGAEGVSATVETDGLAIQPAMVELHHQHRFGVASDQYWQRMAWCETHSNWEDKGKFAGGLGIYVGTWISFGGRQFASKPNKATMTEQIVIANRISVMGFQTKYKHMELGDKPHFQYAVGFGGWGCSAVVGKPKLRRYNPQ